MGVGPSGGRDRPEPAPGQRRPSPKSPTNTAGADAAARPSPLNTHLTPGGGAEPLVERVFAAAGGATAPVRDGEFQKVLQIPEAPWAMLGSLCPSLGNLLLRTLRNHAGKPAHLFTGQDCADALMTLCSGDRSGRLRLGFELMRYNQSTHQMITGYDCECLMRHLHTVMSTTATPSSRRSHRSGSARSRGTHSGASSPQSVSFRTGVSSSSPSPASSPDAGSPGARRRMDASPRRSKVQSAFDILVHQANRLFASISLRVWFADAAPGMIVTMTPHGCDPRHHWFTGTVLRVEGGGVVMVWNDPWNGGPHRQHKIPAEGRMEPREWWDGQGKPRAAVDFEQYCRAVEANPSVLQCLGAHRQGARPRAGSAHPCDSPRMRMRSEAQQQNHPALLAIMQGVFETHQVTSGPVQRAPDLPEADGDLYFDIHDTPWRFRSHRPRVFKEVRALEGVTDGMLAGGLGMEGLLGSLLLGTLGTFRSRRSEAQSGAAVITSHDGRFILKEATNEEMGTMLRIVDDYVAHLQKHRKSQLCRFYALYSVVPVGRSERATGGERHFIVMQNLFFPWTDGIQRYDLKGSSYRRTRLPAHVRALPHPDAPSLLYDDDVRTLGKRFVLGPRREALLAQVTRDAQFLATKGLFDYSFLIGERDAGITTPSCDVRPSSAPPGSDGGAWSAGYRPAPVAGGVTPATYGSNQLAGGPSWETNTPVPGTTPMRDANNSIAWHRSGDVELRTGIIDFLETHTARRKLERVTKRVLSRGADPTATSPLPYATRLCDFLEEVLVGEVLGEEVGGEEHPTTPPAADAVAPDAAAPDAAAPDAAAPDAAAPDAAAPDAAAPDP